MSKVDNDLSDYNEIWGCFNREQAVGLFQGFTKWRPEVYVCIDRSSGKEYFVQYMDGHRNVLKKNGKPSEVEQVKGQMRLSTDGIIQIEMMTMPHDGKYTPITFQMENVNGVWVSRNSNYSVDFSQLTNQDAAEALAEQEIAQSKVSFQNIEYSKTSEAVLTCFKMREYQIKRKSVQVLTGYKGLANVKNYIVQ